MFRRNDRFIVIAWLTSTALCVPWQAVVAQQPGSLAAPEPPPTQKLSGDTSAGASRGAGSRPTELETTDVALQEGGRLVGQVYDASGMPAAGVEVALVQYVEWPRVAVTDADGRFAFENLSGGSYQLVADGAGTMVRAWAPNTAPPSAAPEVLVVTADQVVRGGWMEPGRGLVEWCRAHPWLVTIGAATAIAVPLALAADDDDNS